MRKSRRQLHLLRARCRLPRRQVGARLRQGHQRAGQRPPRHDRARARRAAGRGPGHSAGLSRLRAAQDGHGDARRPGGEDLQARRQLRHAARPDRLDQPRRGALLPASAARPTPSSSSTSTWRSRPNDENPVFYVQYAHARICSVLAQCGRRRGAGAARADLSLLTAPTEAALMLQAGRLPATCWRAPPPNLRRTTSPSTCATWRRAFHSYYAAERFLVDDAALARARMALLAATRQVLRNALAVLGVSAPEAMAREADSRSRRTRA